MNALFAAQATAGQQIHETIYEGRFQWPANGADFPCTHSEVIRNPPLVMGGYSPDASVNITVRTDQFAGSRPGKDDFCRLKVRGATDWLPLKVATIVNPPGDLTVTFMCVAENQGA